MPVVFRGDSKYVIGLINHEFTAHDMFLYNCVQLTFDLLGGYLCHAEWVPRAHNAICDGLAR